MKKVIAIKDNLVLHKKYDLCDLIKSKYNETSNALDLPIGDFNEITISNPRAGGSITVKRGQAFSNNHLMSFKGKTLYLWDKFPIPAQCVFEASNKLCTRYRDIFIEFH